MPRPGSHVIHLDWARHHRPVAAATHTATVAIRRPGGTPGVFDPDTGRTPVEPFTSHHSGTARIQVLTAAEQETLVGGQEVTTLGYRVTVDHDAATGAVDFAVNDLVDVTAVDDNGDPTLVGRTLTVVAVARGSLAWERVLAATDDLG